MLKAQSPESRAAASPSDRLRLRRQSMLRLVTTMRFPTIYLVVTAVAGGLTEAVPAEDRVIPPTSFQAYPAGSEITFEWVYSCATTRPCSFSCAGPGSAKWRNISANLPGTTPLGSNPKSPAIFYVYFTVTIPYNTGFRISTGIQGTLACDVVGMTLDYSGPPR
jgi:hypothetical protein